MSGRVKHGDVAVGLLAPIHLAAATGGADAVKLLIEHGADVNKRDVRGMTPLMLAICTDHEDVRVVRLLLDHGADPKLKSKAGESAIDWARKFNQPDILKALGVQPGEPARFQNAQAGSLRESVAKSAALLERTSGTFFMEGGCASCHSHNVVGMALKQAHVAGLHTPVESAELARRVQSRLSWSGQQQSLMMRSDPPGGPSMLGYALMQFAADAAKADATTDAMVQNLAMQQGAAGNWHADGIVRPPMQGSDFTETATAIRSLALYAPPARQEEYQARLKRAVSWLARTEPTTSEDRNMRLLGSLWGGAEKAAIDRYAQDILSKQKPDGGWAQTAYLLTDAYATGESLVALAEAGISPTSSAYRKGVHFLLSTQRADGSWYVASRASKIQPYFQSGFPYDHDQWISMTATAWATMALAHAAPEAKTVAVK